MKIALLGAGAWGTALAIAATPRHEATLWARDPAQAADMARERRNRRYLPEVPLPAGLRVTADRDEALAFARGGLAVIATPMAGLRGQLSAWPDGQAALWLCKGFEAGSGALGHEIARERRPGLPCGVLSGPSFALEVARGQPTALVAASIDADLSAAAVEAFHGDALRIYTTTDVIGVEVGGAVKNVLAIATGIVDGMPEAGLNARAALITRGLAEITRLGLALGARAETFMGLSGLGDLVLTATGELSRNPRVGQRHGITDGAHPGVAPCARAGGRDAHHRSGGRGARRPRGPGAGHGAADDAPGARRGRGRRRNVERRLAARPRPRSRSAARPRTPPRPRRCSGSGCAGRRAWAVERAAAL